MNNSLDVVWTHSFISFTLEYNLLAMLHSFVNMNLQNLLLLNNFVGSAAPAPVPFMNDFTWLMMQEYHHKIISKQKWILQEDTASTMDAEMEKE